MFLVDPMVNINHWVGKFINYSLTETFCLRQASCILPNNTTKYGERILILQQDLEPISTHYVKLRELRFNSQIIDHVFPGNEVIVRRDLEVIHLKVAGRFCDTGYLHILTCESIEYSVL